MARITVDIKDVIEGLAKEKAQSEQAVRRTISDIRSRAPGWISQGVVEEYNIKKKDIKSALKIGSSGSVNIGGTLVDNVTLTYSGRLLTPTHFGMTPKNRPKSGKPYQVKAQIKKGGGKKVLSSIAFLANSGGEGTTQIPFQRRGKARYPIDVIKTISIPQMIEDGQGETKPNVQEKLNEGIKKRFDYQISRINK